MTIIPVPSTERKAIPFVAGSFEISRYALAFVFFAFFGFADEARRNYRLTYASVMKRVGLSTGTWTANEYVTVNTRFIGALLMGLNEPLCDAACVCLAADGEETRFVCVSLVALDATGRRWCVDGRQGAALAHASPAGPCRKNRYRGHPSTQRTCRCRCSLKQRSVRVRPLGTHPTCRTPSNIPLRSVAQKLARMALSSGFAVQCLSRPRQSFFSFVLLVDSLLSIALFLDVSLFSKAIVPR